MGGPLYGDHARLKCVVRDAPAQQHPQGRQVQGGMHGSEVNGRRPRPAGQADAANIERATHDSSGAQYGMRRLRTSGCNSGRRVGGR